MDDIGNLLREARESSGVSITEVSNDLNVKEIVIENIEDGKIGSFKDVFELKQLLQDYGKYLGLDTTKLIDDFNSYLFEYTSKIPIKEIEKTIEIKLKEEKEPDKIISPYTKEHTKYDGRYYIFIYLLIIFLVALTVFFAIKQVTVGDVSTTVISYKG